MAAGSRYTCALTTSGGIRCWGDPGYGQLGNGDGNICSIALMSDVLTGAEAIAAGYHHTCALMTTGGIRCWGDNTYGQLGIGSAGSWWSSPVQAVDPP